MEAFGRAVLIGCAIWISLAGCGGNSSAPIPSSSSGTDACTSGVAISGVLQDAVTHQPVAQGWAMLESGTQLGVTQVYSFYPVQRAATDAQGAFQVCAQSIASPSAIVLVALDSTGLAYPPFVASLSGTADLGTVPMGGEPQKTSAPATITGVITSAPAATAGTFVAQYVMTALDGSKSSSGSPNLWALAIPGLSNSQSNTFSTASGSCAGGAPYCASYTFTLPSQKPVQPFSGGYTQGVGAPVYSIYALTGSSSPCSPSSRTTGSQLDGSGVLIGSPGAQMTASTIAFTMCQ